MRQKIFAVILALLLVNSVAFAEVALTPGNFPDENFRAYIQRYDSNNDGILSDSEINAVTILEIYDREINNLAGIEYFTALEQLFCYTNNLVSLDVSKNQNLLLLECDHNNITKLDLSSNNKLINLECEMNNLTELDLAQNVSLDYMKCYGQTVSGIEILESGDLYQVDLNKYVSSMDKITDIAALNLSGDIFASSDVSFDKASGIFYMKKTPASVRYGYNVEYVRDSEISMDVTLTGTVKKSETDDEKKDDEEHHVNYGGGGGGCNEFFGILPAALITLMLKKKFF